MLTFTETITLYTPLPCPPGGTPTYNRTVVQGCGWHGRKGAKAASAGLAPAHSFTVRIPNGVVCTKAFVPNGLLTNPEAQFTLAAQTRVVRGVGPLAPASGEEWAALLQPPLEGFTLLAFTDARARPAGHMLLEGV